MTSLTPSKTETAEQPNLWPRYWEEGYGYERPRRGDLLTGTVLQVRPEALLVDIGVKRDGVVPLRDLKELDEDIAASFRAGCEVPVFVVRPRNAEGELVLSISRAKEMQDWREARRLRDSGEIIELQVREFNKGGILVSFGQLHGFVPASHLMTIPKGVTGEKRRQLLASQVGEILPLKVIEADRRHGRLVLSHREAHRDYREQRKEELLRTLQVGDVVTGKVTSLQKFGAFVDIGGSDGLVHRSEISHERIGHPLQMLEVGQEVEVYVLRLDQERKRIGLSIKRLLPDPWEDAPSRYHPGQIVEATITHVVGYGAFAELVPGIEGLIHVSELSREFVEDARDIVSAGDRVMVKILRVDPEQHRMSLNLKDAPQWIEVAPTETNDEVESEEFGEAGADESFEGLPSSMESSLYALTEASALSSQVFELSIPVNDNDG